MNLPRWLTVLLLCALSMFTPRVQAGVGTCSVNPAVVPMEAEYTISAIGLRPNASHGITVRQTGRDSFTKGIGSHPNAGLLTDGAGNGTVTLIAHGIDTYTDPRLVLS